MKTTKRIFACLLIVVMLASMLCVGANAVSPDATITINGAAGTTYTAYKVLNVEATTDTSGNVVAILYTWANDAFADATTYEVVTTDDGGNSYVSIADGKVVNFASDMLASATVTATAAATETIATGASSVDMAIANANGYYVMKSSASTIPFAFTIYNGKIVTPTADASHNVTYIDTDTITEKTQLPAVAKSVKDNQTSFYIGETIEYTTTITAKVGALEYVLHDDADAGITIDTTSIVVKKGSTTVDAGTTTFSVKTDSLSDTCDFHIVFAKEFCDTLNTGDIVTVTYNGKLNANANISGNGFNTNTAWLTHGTGGILETDDAEVSVTTYQLTVNKTDKGGNPLADATFSLYTDSTCSTLATFSGSGTEFVLDPAGGVTDFTTTASGSFVLKGLCGNYWLKETDAPAGYKIDDEVKAADVTAANLILDITNTAGNPLPETGGIGTTVFYAAGGILVLGALVVLLMKKRTVA